MKVILYMAMTVNGMIARENDKEDFLSDVNWNEFCKLAKSAGCFVVGRRTFDVVKKHYKKYDFDDVKAKCIVVSAKGKSLPKGYLLARSPSDAVKIAASMGFHEMILTGGSHLNSSFMKAGLVDEIILDIEPALLGKGIPVLREENFYSRLELIKSIYLKVGIIQVHYKVKKSAKEKRR